MQTSTDQFSTCGDDDGYCNGSDYLLPREYLNGGSCVINSPTIIHNPTIINGHNDQNGFPKWFPTGRNQTAESHCQVSKPTTTTTMTTITKNDKPEGTEDQPNPQSGIFQNPHPMFYPAPSGCQELPGSTAFDFQIPKESGDWSSRSKTTNQFAPSMLHLSHGSGSTRTVNICNKSDNNPSGTVIQVNATLQLPPNVEHCTVSITATANKYPTNCNVRTRNNFNGGGIVEKDAFNNTVNYDRDDNSPTTPVSWVLPFPWNVNGSTNNTSTDLERLSAAQRVLQMSGWYHEGLSWQQSAALLNKAPVGSWLMRDSSDKRFMYAVSVQTARGPTAVRVHYVCGRFRLDAEPRMAPMMPMFECPVKMIEHYIEYSKKMSEQKEVWVDHSGQLYSQIYLTKPLLKEVRSLSHMARLVVNRFNISTKELPTPLKNYMADYPYTE